MRRRAALRLIAVGAASVTAGCPRGSAPIGTPRPDHPGILTYPDLPPSTYSTDASTVDDFEGTPNEFEALPERIRFIIANAIHRSEYSTATLPKMDDGERSIELVDYRGQTVDVAVGHGDAFTKPEYGPASAGEWRDPVTVDASVSGGELTVTLHTELDRPLNVNHFGRPYFGVLVAVGAPPVVLDHDAYETNEHIRTDGLVRTEYLVERSETTTIEPGNALHETYGVPEDHSGESLVRISTEVGGESADWLGNRATTVATTRRVEF